MRGQPLLVNRRGEERVDFRQRQGSELLRNQPLLRHGYADEAVALAVLSRAALEESGGGERT